MTNRREKILVGVIALLAAVYLCRFLGNRFVLEPMRRQSILSDQLQREIRVKEKQLETVRISQSDLARWRERSLTPDVPSAQTQYEQYLFELVQKHGVGDWVVEPGTVLKEEHLTRFPFRVTGQITLHDLTGLLYEIYQNQLLHRVRRLQLQRLSDGENEVRVVLNLEAISVQGAEERSELLPATLAAGGPLGDSALEDFAIISERNILSPLLPIPIPAAPIASSPSIAQPAPSELIRLTGTPFWGDSRQAWLHDQRNNASWVFEHGQKIELAGLSGTLASIEQSHIELLINGRRWSLRLNDTLQQITEVD